MSPDVKSLDDFLPAFPLPAGVLSEDAYLRRLVFKRAETWWPPKPPVSILFRLHRELDVICRWCPRLFLILDDLAKAAHDHGIAFSLNQGEQCGCVTLRALGLAPCDPTERELLFEPFLNPDFGEQRPSLFTVKTDKPGRDWMIVYLTRKYGADHVPCLTRKIRLVAAGDHPVVAECLRETNGLLLYREQLAEIIHIMSGRPLAWAMGVCEHLADRRQEAGEEDWIAFLDSATSNPVCRIGEWKEESALRTYLESLWPEWQRAAVHLVSQAHVACADPLPRTPTLRKVVGEVTIADIAEALRCGDRVAIVMRHAERVPVSSRAAGAKPIHERDRPITDCGRRRADALGFALFEYCRGYSSRVYSGVDACCQQTALELAKHSGQNISLDYFLGNGSPFFGDMDDYSSLVKAGHFHESVNDYFKVGVQSGFRDFASAGETFERHLWEDFSDRLGVFVTHDVNVACFLAGHGVCSRFDFQNWPHDLDAAVAFLGRYGHARYGVMRAPRDSSAMSERSEIVRNVYW
jgi:broad specificity phosphatase PhoE